jgi:hypothetical protein
VPDRRAAFFALTLLAALLAACAGPVALPREGERRVPADFPAGEYRQLLAEGRPVLRVDPARSVVVIEVRRGGSLARFGHDHVVASHDVAGFVAPDEGRADLYVPLATLAVDEPGARTEARLDTQPAPADVEGTRRNMLDKVLEVERYPYAHVAIGEIDGGSPPRPLRAAVTLHGVTRPVDVAPRIEQIEGALVATGTFDLDQSGFGIAPFSILGGAIAVQDRVRVRFRIHASRAE